MNATAIILSIRSTDIKNNNTGRDRIMYKNTCSRMSLQWKPTENLSCWNEPKSNIESIMIPMLEIVRALDVYSHMGLCCLDIKDICISEKSIRITGEKLSLRMNSNPIYVAPEIKMGCCKDTSLAVVYSIGVILYTKLFNAEPSIKLAELYSSINYSNSVYCSTLDKERMSSLDRFIRHTFTISRYARWSLKQVLSELEAIVKSFR